MKHLFLLCSLACVVLACAAPAKEAPPVPLAALAPATCGSIPNLHALGDVWFAGQPSAEDFALAKAQGVKTVFNLRRAGEQAGFDEQAHANALGLTYVNLPIGGPSDLTDEVFQRAREILSNAERPLLVHCASANRVGAVYVPWRVLDGGVTLEQALSEAHEIGLKSPELEAKAREYVMRAR